ncbi:ABC transporter ATP-binding protein [Halorientalis salina]|uniref:ABC transporter ATP-binding protein n=1 Tax=Halorientalis salina TaxID=2932266 RepID=UPI0010ABEDD6|nr:phosphate ABC transporter ATP-binding protein [Halorientalis salina]
MTLRASGVSVAFDGQSVLEDVTLGVDPGEVLTVVGPSGTGKTTLLRALAMFQRPDDGTVEWTGDDVWALPDEDRLAVRRRLSMVFQEPSLFNARVAENVGYGLRIRRSWRDRIGERLRTLLGNSSVPESVHDSLETVGLTEKAEQNALALSGGEAQRVAFARALAVDPTVVLLDEPTSNLDPRNTAVLENAVDRARDRGVGVVVATHDMHQARRLSDRVAFLYDGTVVESGPPEQVFEDPEDWRTAAFVAGELLYESDSGRPMAAQSP